MFDVALALTTLIFWGFVYIIWMIAFSVLATLYSVSVPATAGWLVIAAIVNGAWVWSLGVMQFTPTSMLRWAIVFAIAAGVVSGITGIFRYRNGGSFVLAEPLDRPKA